MAGSGIEHLDDPSPENSQNRWEQKHDLSDNLEEIFSDVPVSARGRRIPGKFSHIVTETKTVSLRGQIEGTASLIVTQERGFVLSKKPHPHIVFEGIDHGQRDGAARSIDRSFALDDLSALSSQEISYILDVFNRATIVKEDQSA
jgi:hypothetical protein